MRSFARLLSLALIAAAVLAPVQAAAQAAATIARVEVGLWPEYDQRAMLVIYRVTLPQGTAFPAAVELPIPARIGDPTAVAQQAADGALILVDYTRQAATGEWASLLIQAESAVVQVEYYDTLAIEGAARSFTFTWPAGWPVAELAYEVQQPAGGSAMKIEPAAGTDRTGSNGLTYYTGSLGTQDGSAEAQLQVSYTKSDAGLTVELVSPSTGSESPAIGAAEPSGLSTSLVGWAPWAIGGLGVVLLAAGAVLFIRSRRAEAAGGRMRHRSANDGVPGVASLDASAVFCHTCGTQAGVTDVFCRKCGTRLRS
jgi:hypothetical protein